MQILSYGTLLSYSIVGQAWNSHTLVERETSRLQAGCSVSDLPGMRHVLECNKCHKTYSSPHTLRRHVRLECGQEPRFLCPYCPHRTKQRYNLMLHIGRTHRDSLQSAGVMLDKQPYLFIYSLKTNQLLKQILYC